MTHTIKLVDQSHFLGYTDIKRIDSKEKLFNILKNYLDKLCGSEDTDSKLFWATYSVFVVKKHRICLCSAMGTTYPIFDVDVKKSDLTDIRVEPYKIDRYREYDVKSLCRTYDVDDLIGNKYNWAYSDNHYVSPLQVLGYEDNPEQCWKGTVTVRTNFTEWNMIHVDVDRVALEKDFNYGETGSDTD